MTLSSKNLAGFAVALAVLGLVAWMSASMLNKPKTTVVGSVEISDVGSN